MLRAAGAVCVLLGAAALGYSSVQRLKERAQTLSRLIGALGHLEEELTFCLTPLPALLDSLARQTEGTVGRFFQSCLDGMRAAPQAGLRTSWRQAVDDRLGVLREEAQEAVRSLGDTLGRYDGEEQRQALRQTVARLERLRQQSEEERARLGKVYTTVSLAAGALAVIVLI